MTLRQRSWSTWQAAESYTHANIILEKLLLRGGMEYTVNQWVGEANNRWGLDEFVLPTAPYAAVGRANARITGRIAGRLTGRRVIKYCT